ncbi:MAG: phage baseplate assembly protein V [Oscillospiraceae bacterium]|nr:phage baseplate assembly protein V [Oscillospiraceae bacterium]
MLEEIFELIDNEYKTNDSKIYGVVTGTVTNNFNPSEPMCVQVKIGSRSPGMNITGWARLVTPFTGKGYGMYYKPDTGDEVLVVFENGEIDKPIVVGCLYTPSALPDMKITGPANSLKCIKTKSGHIIEFDETPGETKIEISTPAKVKIKLDDIAKTVSIEPSNSDTSIKIDGMSGNVNIKGKTKISVKCGTGEITLNSAGNKLDLKGDTITIKAAQMLSLEGQQVKLKGATTAAVEAGSTLDLKSSGMANLKGSMVRLN